jgi:dsRNA-specific ribonuclease
VVDELGSGYKKLYVVELLIDDLPVARGQDYSIKGAEQLAAEKAWTSINAES